LKAIDGTLESEDSKDVASQVLSLMVDAGNNLAACYLKLELFPKAEDACIAVLTVSPDNQKALYRAGISAMQQTKFNESRLALEKLLSIDPENAAAKKQLRELAKRETKYREAERALFKTMGQSMFYDGKGAAAPPLRAEAASESTEKAESPPKSPASPKAERKVAHGWAALGIALVLIVGAILVLTTNHDTEASSESKDL
jgi:tetratricopeptide (TPR) repeat protein